MGGGLLYAFPMQVPEEGIDRKRSFHSYDTDSDGLINEDFQIQCHFITKGKVYGRKNLRMLLEFIDISEERERRRKCLELTLTTGPTPDTRSRYNQSF